MTCEPYFIILEKKIQLNLKMQNAYLEAFDTPN